MTIRAPPSIYSEDIFLHDFLVILKRRVASYCKIYKKCFFGTIYIVMSSAGSISQLHSNMLLVVKEKIHLYLKNLCNQIVDSISRIFWIIVSMRRQWFKIFSSYSQRAKHYYAVEDMNPLLQASITKIIKTFDKCYLLLMVHVYINIFYFI